MAGLGAFLVDLHQATGEARYQQEALRFADRIMLYAIEKKQGLVFPGEELIRLSTDYGTGSVGIGLFFHRLVSGGDTPFFDF
jgi:hypothetical protein